MRRKIAPEDRWKQEVLTSAVTEFNEVTGLDPPIPTDVSTHLMAEKLRVYGRALLKAKDRELWFSRETFDVLCRLKALPANVKPYSTPK